MAVTDWGEIQRTLSSGVFTARRDFESLTTALGQSKYSYYAGERPQLLPLPETTMSEPDINLIRGQLLLKLLDIEATRCNAKSDEDDRTDSLAQVLEGDSHIVERIHSGMAKYMALLGIDDTPPVLSIAEMQESSVFNPQPSPRRQGTVVVEVGRQEAEVWDQVKREAGRNGLDFNRLSLMNIQTHRGGHSSPEDQITCTFRILR